MESYNLLAVVGPTASGKTAFAARLAFHLNGEVISADSRQVYRRMDIGTGKDMNDYLVSDTRIPVHLTDIADPGSQYNIFEYQRDFFRVLSDVRQRGKFPVLCGGSGLYIEAVLQNYKLVRVPVNESLRNELKNKSLEELTTLLKSYPVKLHNITDIVNEKRAVRAIEIADYYSGNQVIQADFPQLKPLVTGIRYDVEVRRERITGRLYQRLDEGMVEEVKKLLEEGISPDDLIYYGLEYKYITYFLTGKIRYDEMVEKLNIAIHQFAKRQMTWFRKMEREGTVIHWLEGELPMEHKIQKVMEWLY